MDKLKSNLSVSILGKLQQNVSQFYHEARNRLWNRLIVLFNNIPCRHCMTRRTTLLTKRASWSPFSPDHRLSYSLSLSQCGLHLYLGNTSCCADAATDVDRDQSPTLILMYMTHTHNDTAYRFCQFLATLWITTFRWWQKKVSIIHVSTTVHHKKTLVLHCSKKIGYTK